MSDHEKFHRTFAQLDAREPGITKAFAELALKVKDEKPRWGARRVADQLREESGISIDNMITPFVAAATMVRHPALADYFKVAPIVMELTIAHERGDRPSGGDGDGFTDDVPSREVDVQLEEPSESVTITNPEALGEALADALDGIEAAADEPSPMGQVDADPPGDAAAVSEAITEVIDDVGPEPTPEQREKIKAGHEGKKKAKQPDAAAEAERRMAENSGLIKKKTSKQVPGQLAMTDPDTGKAIAEPALPKKAKREAPAPKKAKSAEPTIAKRPEGYGCCNCGEPEIRAYNRCNACYIFARKRGRERPLAYADNLRAVRRLPMVSVPVKTCQNCSAAGVSAQDRCHPCYLYWMRSGKTTERPTVVAERLFARHAKAAEVEPAKTKAAKPAPAKQTRAEVNAAVKTAKAGKAKKKAGRRSPARAGK